MTIFVDRFVKTVPTGIFAFFFSFMLTFSAVQIKPYFFFDQFHSSFSPFTSASQNILLCKIVVDLGSSSRFSTIFIDLSYAFFVLPEAVAIVVTWRINAPFFTIKTASWFFSRCDVHKITLSKRLRSCPLRTGVSGEPTFYH